MTTLEILSDKTLKGKEKTNIIAEQLLTQVVLCKDIMGIIGFSKDTFKAICLEALEIATKTKPELIHMECIEVLDQCLISKSPRVKWESARVIGNCAAFFKDQQLELVIPQLIMNTEDSGTVVRWSSAFALTQLAKKHESLRPQLKPMFESIVNREEKNSIRKMYVSALRKC